MSFPLAGLKVLDMSRVLAGPFAGRMLCDLGADVVKLEPPEGDVTRLWGAKVAGIAGYFHQQNAGKRTVSVNLTQPEGVDLVKSLVGSADILIENFRPDVMGRLGLDYDTLAAINPSLIMLSISGFGAGNPDSRRAAYAPIVHAEAGLVHRQAILSDAYPADIALSVADTNASLHGLVGILSALYRREQTGQGDHIDIAMIDATLVTNDGMHYALDDVKPPLPNEVYTTAGGAMMIAGDFRWIWHQLAKVYGVQDGLGDDADLKEKIAARRDAVTRFLNETCKDRAAVIEALDKMNLAWGDVRPAGTIEELASVQARGSVTRVDYGAGESRQIPQSPYRFRNGQSQVQGPAATLGEHNNEVLADWLGWSEDEISAYEGVLVRVDEAADKKV